MARHRYRSSTEGSSKWLHGHNVGCVFYAPAYECICQEFDLTEESQPMTYANRQLLIWAVLAIIVGIALGFVLDRCTP